MKACIMGAQTHKTRGFARKQSQVNSVLKDVWLICDLETEHEHCMFSVRGTEISKIQFTLDKVGRHGHPTFMENP